MDTGWLLILYLPSGAREGLLQWVACFSGSHSCRCGLFLQPFWWFCEHRMHEIPFCLNLLVLFLFRARDWCVTDIWPEWGKGMWAGPKQPGFSIVGSGDIGNVFRQSRTREGITWTYLCYRKIFASGSCWAPWKHSRDAGLTVLWNSLRCWDRCKRCWGGMFFAAGRQRELAWVVSLLNILGFVCSIQD